MREGIPVTSIEETLIDLAAGESEAALERAINEADRLDLIDPERLRGAVDGFPHRPGRATLAAILDRQTFRLTDSELERRFLRLVRLAGLPTPLTRQWVSGFRVDFYWPDLGLVVETDGLRYHRTAQRQARDRRRGQAHLACGLTPLRFTHDQVRHEPRQTVSILVAVANRLRTGGYRAAGGRSGGT